MKNKTSWTEILLALLLMPIEIFINAFVTTKLWSWFIVAEFGVKELSYQGALGIGLLLGFLIYRQDLATKDDVKTEKDGILTLTLKSIVLALWALFIGWLIQLIF